MHVCTIKGSKYAAICYNMLEYAFISKQYLKIIRQNLTIDNQEKQKSETKNFCIYNITNQQIILSRKLTFTKKWQIFSKI